MADGPKFSDFTTGEKLRVIALTARMAKRGLADDGSGRIIRDLQQRVEAIENQALKRKKK